MEDRKKSISGYFNSLKYYACPLIFAMFAMSAWTVADVYIDPENSPELHSRPLSIYVFGDSHCFAFDTIKWCRPIHMGAVTMHRIGRDGTLFLDVRNHEVKEGDIVVFTFGEIDVRCHLKKQCELQNKTPNDLIETLSTKFIQVVLQNKSFFNDLTCVICSVTPPTDAHLSLDYPFYGSLKERIAMTQALNAKLAALCKKHDVLFLDIYSNYADSEGGLNPLLSDGTVHIGRDYSAAIREKLLELLD